MLSLKNCLFIPSVFTPNGDNETNGHTNEENFYNDYFTLKGKSDPCYDVMAITIYNRWGQVIFISTGNNLKWDGRTNVGIPAPEGTYFYTIDIKEKSYNGSLSLFR